MHGKLLERHCRQHHKGWTLLNSERSQGGRLQAKQAFGRVAAEYVRRYSRAHNRTWEEAERLLTRADLAAWKSRDIRLIRRRDVLDVLDSVVERGSPVLANRLLARLKHFFKWTVERGILEASPVLGLRPPSPESPRDRVLTDHELRAVWKAAEDIGYPFGAAIQLLILTGQRRSEVLEAEWSEIDLPGRLWTVPRERSKTDSAHLVPLSDAAADLLSELPRVGTQLVFTTNGTAPFSGVSKAFECLNLRVAEHLGCPIPQWRPHDLRRTFASGCARLGIPVHVIERALNHTSGTFGGIVGVYQRHDYAEERRRAMDAWGTHLVRLVGKKPTDADTLPRVAPRCDCLPGAPDRSNRFSHRSVWRACGWRRRTAIPAPRARVRGARLVAPIPSRAECQRSGNARRTPP